LAFELPEKFRSFNQQQHRADTASNPQTAAMLGVMGNATLKIESLKIC